MKYPKIEIKPSGKGITITIWSDKDNLTGLYLTKKEFEALKKVLK